MSSPETRAFIALGGNLGDVLGTFREALVGLEARGFHVKRLSSAYRTLPLTDPGQVGPVPDYWNAVCEVETRQDALQCLSALQELEQRAGRVRTERWASRPLDLDLLVFGDEIIHRDDLVVPHPRMRGRAFVMRPLAEIAPKLRLQPDGESAERVSRGLRGETDGILEVLEFRQGEKERRHRPPTQEMDSQKSCFY
jgi:2-amino-4-hydroxy-6-hydroxymethyldihydropteridine diphosphokinase